MKQPSAIQPSMPKALPLNGASPAYRTLPPSKILSYLICSIIKIPARLNAVRTGAFHFRSSGQTRTSDQVPYLLCKMLFHFIF